MMLPDIQLRQIVENELSRGIGHAFSRADIRLGENYEGEASIYVKAFLKPDHDRPGPLLSLGIMARLREQLAAAGESRQPYLDLDYPDDVAA